jgi:hypothetical protein
MDLTWYRIDVNGVPGVGVTSAAQPTRKCGALGSLPPPAHIPP